MSAYQKSIDLGLTGSDAEIVAALRATGVTARKISLADLLFTLNNRGMLVRLIRPADTGEKWSGTAVNMVLAINASGTQEQAFAVNQWFSHITNDRNQFFDTTEPAFATAFWALSQSVAGGPGMPSAADFSAVAALGGGWLFANLTVEQFAEQREAAQLSVDRELLQSEWISLLNEIINPALATGDRATLRAAVEQAAEAI
jgi:hypothetical protein